jgi:hypothetical protein
MLSRVIPLEYLKERDVMYWLPPGGHDNEVWADTWVVLAELEPADAEPVLDLLGDNDIGAYIAGPSVRKGAPKTGMQLYVDCQQHTKATDVLMLFLRKKHHPPAVAARAAKKPKRAEPAAAKTKPAAVRAAVMALKIAIFAAMFALLVLVAYTEGSRLFPTVHPAHHPAPNSDVPGMKGSNP